MVPSEGQGIDKPTIIGLALLLLPLTTMWHEIGGHAAACAIVGGHIDTIGAFYVDCGGVAGLPRMIVACAGVFVDSVLAIACWLFWRRANTDWARLVLWYLWVGKGFVAAGYFCFSGVSGVGDLGATAAGGIGPLPYPWAWRAAFLMIGGIVYWRLIVAAIKGLTEMLGDSTATKPSRRTIAHLYYVTIGGIAVLVGLLNPVGIFITIMSAAASSFGGNAGYISIGYAVPNGAIRRSFVIRRNVPVIIAGIALSIAFAALLGPSRHF